MGETQVAGRVREELVLEPVSGKALPVYQGEVLRLSQMDGEQCVDFNCFNLHDYKERMSVGHSRRQSFRIRQGHVVLSNRLRPLLLISHMPQTCVTDLLGARCNAPMFERRHGFKDHTNCQDTLAAAIGEYDLTPDDVHDSFNMWMNTNWDASGRWWIEWNTGRPDDHVDLLACVDTLCVPVVCGSGDVHPTSNFDLRPIRVQVLERTDATVEQAQALLSRLPSTAHRTPEDFQVREIKADRQLRQNKDYVPNFPRYPLSRKAVQVTLTRDVVDGLQRLVEKGFAKDEEDAARKAFMVWYIRNVAPAVPDSGDRFRW